jgi:hypothetical protein
MDTTKAVVPDGTVGEGKGGSQEDRKSRKARRSLAPSANADRARYFLAADGSGADGSSLALGTEFSTEDEVLVASFQKGVAFYRVETWKTRAEKKGRSMVLRKQS